MKTRNEVYLYLVTNAPAIPELPKTADMFLGLPVPLQQFAMGTHSDGKALAIRLREMWGEAGSPIPESSRPLLANYEEKSEVWTAYAVAGWASNLVTAARAEYVDAFEKTWAVNYADSQIDLICKRLGITE